jgi:NAD(P)-dependent dehydrogenase (short-subunit alcohol dehydrogenase family)
MSRQGTALVTGGGVRIGRALALALDQLGYTVALHYNTSADGAEQVAQTIEADGGECDLFPCNFANPDQVSRFISSVFECRPDCNVLINNASIFEKAPLTETSDDLLDQTMAINLRAPMVLTREFARLAPDGACVINITDTKAARTVTEYFAYTLSKKALLEFTKMAAKELAPGVRVNAIAPGLILPPDGENEFYLQELARGVPMLRPGGVEDVVQAMGYILEAYYMTGQCIYIDGGEHLK